MRVTRETLETHRAAILGAAASLFRERGLAGVSVADVTRAAGLTHGAFYGHFASKAALAAAATADIFARGAERWRRRAERARAEGRDPLDAIIDAYLTEAHRDAPEGGCPLPTIGAELAREAGPLRAALNAGVEQLLDVLSEEIGRARPELPTAECARRGMAVLAALSGGLALARALADPALSRDALRAAARAARAAAGH